MCGSLLSRLSALTRVGAPHIFDVLLPYCVVPCIVDARTFCGGLLQGGTAAEAAERQVIREEATATAEQQRTNFDAMVAAARAAPPPPHDPMRFRAVPPGMTGYPNYSLLCGMQALVEGVACPVQHHVHEEPWTCNSSDIASAYGQACNARQLCLAAQSNSPP